MTEIDRDVLQKDFDDLRAAVALVISQTGPDMQELITRPSGSVNGGAIRAARWWWILRGAMERTWGRYGKDVPTADVWQPDAD